MRKRRAMPVVEPEPISDRFCEWAASLPYVVQRSHGLSRTVSMFEVDCAPLDRRLTWLVVDDGPSTGASARISLRLPEAIARAAERSRLGLATTRVLPEHVLFRVDPLAPLRDVASLVLAAYGSAMS
jgi:hypothetical protein